MTENVPKMVNHGFIAQVVVFTKQKNLMIGEKLLEEKKALQYSVIIHFDIQALYNKNIWVKLKHSTINVDLEK